MNVTVNGTFYRTGVTDSAGDPLTSLTTLNTGLGTHDITVDLLAGSDGPFVLNTQGPFSQYLSYPNQSTVDASASTLPLIIFGGQGTSNITGGQGSDIIFGHRGEVLYTNARGQVVTILGNGGPGDENSGLLLPPSSIIAVGPNVGGITTDRGRADPGRIPAEVCRPVLWTAGPARLELHLRRGGRLDHRRTG